MSTVDAFLVYGCFLILFAIMLLEHDSLSKRIKTLENAAAKQRDGTSTKENPGHVIGFCGSCGANLYHHTEHNHTTEGQNRDTERTPATHSHDDRTQPAGH